jgi:hypothetical protein
VLFRLLELRARIGILRRSSKIPPRFGAAELSYGVAPPADVAAENPFTENTMAKAQDAQKSTKKAPAKSMKEKKAEKKMKKDGKKY